MVALTLFTMKNLNKSTTAKDVKGSYTGLSSFETWDEMKTYIVTQKIGPYTHFYNRFQGSRLIESWTVGGNIVSQIILGKLRKLYDEHGRNLKKKKQPLRKTHDQALR